MENILFVSHDASRTGAPIVLLNFIKLLATNNTYNCSVLLKSGGVLVNQFQELVPTHQLNFGNDSIINRVAKKLKSIVNNKTNKKFKLSSKLKKEKFDLIYLNTVLSLDMAFTLKNIFKCPVIAHIHENEFATTYLYPNGFNQKDIDNIDKFIAVSQSTKDNLINNYQIPNKKIDVIYPLINTDKQLKISREKNDIIKELRFEDSFIVGGSGDCNWRKGVDLFIQLAAQLSKRRPTVQVKFLWLGNFTYEFFCQTKYELKKLGLTDVVKFVGSKPDPHNYFQVFDIFTLTSREDPFPLVALEAAAMQKPIIFFDNVGGMSELFQNDIGGMKSSFVDVSEMVDKILYLIDNRILLLKKGREAANLVKRYDVHVISKLIVETINTTIQDN